MIKLCKCLKPFFSVIIPTYNRYDFLNIAIKSVLTQTFTNFELIIVDDGSNDNTKDMITKIDDSRLSYIYQTNQGVSKARNTGLAQAKGEFICFLDSDDRFRKEKLEITYDYIKNYPDYKIFHTEEIWYRRGTILTQKVEHKKPSGRVFAQALRLCCISISTVAVNHEVFTELGNFDISMPACEDYDFWLRVTNKYPVFLIPEYLTIKEGGYPDQQSSKYPAMDKFRIYALNKIINSGNLLAKDYALAQEELSRKADIYIAGALKRGKLDEVKNLEKYARKS